MARRIDRQKPVHRARTYGSATKQPKSDIRLRIIRSIVCIGIVAIVQRLFVLQVLSHAHYTELAARSHNIMSELSPKRGTVYVRDKTAAQGVYPVAVNMQT